MTRQKTPAPDRFWAKVNRGPDCWTWTAGRMGAGYGVFYPTKRNPTLAHRYSYLLAYGPIPNGLQIDHLCRNRTCVNPVHLEAVTREENLRRGLGYGLQNGLRDTCTKGHEATPENRYTNPTTGKTSCRECARISDRQPNRTRAARRARKDAA